MVGEKAEQTLVLIKPDALKNSLTGYVLSQLSEFHAGVRFAGAKIVHVSRMLAEEHYAEHRGKAFYPALLDYIRGLVHYPDSPEKRRVIALVYHGENAIQKIRNIAGPTNPHVARDTRPGCIRALGTVVPIVDDAGRIIAERMDNLIHASSNPADAEREIKLWFRPTDIPPLMRIYPVETCQDHFYYKQGAICCEREEGCTSLLAPGDIAWASDMEVLRCVLQGTTPPYPVNAVAAKYMINEAPEPDEL